MSLFTLFLNKRLNFKRPKTLQNRIFMSFSPSYIELFRSGSLKISADKAYDVLNNCTSCPHNCKVNRFKNEAGKCASGHLPIVSTFTTHFGEEPVLSGTKGAEVPVM